MVDKRIIQTNNKSRSDGRIKCTRQKAGVDVLAACSWLLAAGKQPKARYKSKDKRQKQLPKSPLQGIRGERRKKGKSRQGCN